MLSMQEDAAIRSVEASMDCSALSRKALVTVTETTAKIPRSRMVTTHSISVKPRGLEKNLLNITNPVNCDGGDVACVVILDLECQHGWTVVGSVFAEFQ